MTRGNIGKELDIHLRKTMGVLNDSDKDLNEICSEFRKEGKKLNRVVHKAAGMKKVFNDDERKHMARLNHVLVDLMAIMRGEIEESATSTVKRLIQAFVSEATAVAQIVESKNPKPVQEAFFETSSKSKRSKEESFRGLNDDRLKLLKKKGLFGKIFGKKDEPTAKKNEPRSDGLPKSFPITADELNKILKIIEDKTKKPCSRILTQKDHVSPDKVKPTSSVRGGIPPFIGEIPTDSEGRQLRFVAQINFADVSGVPGLPSDGIMQFWLDRHMEIWVRDPDRKEGKHYTISNKKYRVLYYSPEDMKTKDRTTELHDQIDMSIYEDSESELCFGKLTDVALLGFNKTENCLSMFSFDEIDNYEVLFMDTWNDVISDPENTIKDVKEVYGILKQIPKGFSDQSDGKGLFDNFGWKIGGYPGFVQSDFRKYDYDTKFTSDNTFLLLQMDSDGPIMWGDCGTAQIFITKEALAKRDFSKAVFEWACY